MPVKEKTPTSVKCPFCLALRGKPCINSKTNEIRSRPHNARVKRFTERGGVLAPKKMNGRAPRRTYNRPKHDKMLPVRISPELLNRVDAVRPEELPREAYIRYLLDIGLQQVESA